MNLTEQEKNRYSRHLLLEKVGMDGQIKLKEAKVLVIGAGGLGCPILQYLTAAGVGNIGIIDFDTVDESNLQRQILYTVNDLGKNKALAAKERLFQLNPYVNFQVYQEKLSTNNALEIFSKYSIIVDGTDNFSTRYLVNDACVIMDKPLVYGAIYKFEGQVSVFNYQGGPTYRCLFPEPPLPGSVPSCSDIGVIGVLPGIIGTQQANEVLKLILDIGDTLSGKLVTYNSLNNSFLSINIDRSEEEVHKVLKNSDNFEQMDYDSFCGLKIKKQMKEISFKELEEMLVGKEDFQILDVRQVWEQPRIDSKNVLVAPLNELDNFIDQVEKNKKVIVTCQHGIRSVAAINHLESKYHFTNLINLDKGLVN
jgi:adenylyltransferase/sulfurtransferase